jgi:hypothetical protein
VNFTSPEFLIGLLIGFFLPQLWAMIQGLFNRA